jgi:hypothetical protein
METVTEAEVSPATKKVQFVGLENLDSQTTRSPVVSYVVVRVTPRPTVPKPSRAERETFDEFLRSFKSRIANSGSGELRKFNLSATEGDRLRMIKITCWLPLNDRKEAGIALFWWNTELLRLYQEIIEVIRTFPTRKLWKNAVNKSMKLVANFKGERCILRQLPLWCKELDENGVEFMFWDWASNFLAVKYQ